MGPEAKTAMSSEASADVWRAKKRRRKEPDMPVAKSRKLSNQESTTPLPSSSATEPVKPVQVSEDVAKQAPSLPGLGLAYGSDDD
jgi:hypothetical protein